MQRCPALPRRLQPTPLSAPCSRLQLPRVEHLSLEPCVEHNIALSSYFNRESSIQTITSALIPIPSHTAHMPATRSRQSTAGPSSPSLRRRLRRATSHLDPDTSPTQTPEGPTATSSSAESSPDLLEEVSVKQEPEEMLHREGAASRRSKNIEDINDIEEKGLYRRDSNSSHDSGVTGRLLDEKARSERAPSEEKEGLSSRRDKEAFALLVVLCKHTYLPSSYQTADVFRSVRLIAPPVLFCEVWQPVLMICRLQGIPLGLTFGTLPFLLKPHLSYSQLAIFALSTWPYSLKLLWSPIVDAWFVPKWGRRKSWIVPVQAIVGMGLWIIGGRVEDWLNQVS